VYLKHGQSYLHPSRDFAPTTENLVNSMVQEIVIQQGRLLPTSLPKASTALPEDPGPACLRALVALAIYRKGALHQCDCSRCRVMMKRDELQLRRRKRLRAGHIPVAAVASLLRRRP
jgi:hypothetical protein